MNVANLFKSMTPIEMVLLVVFVLYIVLPIETPEMIAPSIDSPLGMLVMFCITLYLFLYSNPVLGVLYILVAYELLRRSSKKTLRSDTIQHVPSNEKRDEQIRVEQPVANSELSLEEEVIAQRAPLRDSQKGSEYVDSAFKPVADATIPGVSLF
jgi:hypothetical protein